MEIYFYVFIVLGCCSNVFGSDEKSYRYRYNRNFVYNPDEYAKVTRPCKVLDLNCISKYFAYHAPCTVPSTPLPNVLTREQVTLFLPVSNSTITQTNSIIRGFRNARIEEFYLNKATDNAVFAVEFRNLSVVIRNSYFNFYREGQEPVVVASNSAINYTSLIVTAVIPKIDKLELEKAEITAYAPDPNPQFTAGPEVTNSTDPTVQQGYAAIQANIPVVLQELLLTESPFYLLSYLQSTICDYGLKIT